jgi:hypothetical protein
MRRKWRSNVVSNVETEIASVLPKALMKNTVLDTAEEVKMARLTRFQQYGPLARGSELTGDVVYDGGLGSVVAVDRQHIDVDFDKKGVPATDRLGDGYPADQRQVVVAD